jgi:aryl-alcohol dehydrogenase-like predicted oxidoreductase
MIHWPDPQTPLEDTIEVLIDLKDSGKIRYYGISNFPVEWVRSAARISAPTAVETGYSLLDRTAEDVMSTCASLGLPILAYGVLAQGLLTGKYQPSTSFPENDRRNRLRVFDADRWSITQQVLSRLEQVAAKHGKSVAQTAIRWALDRPGVSCAIVGAKTAAQVSSNVGAAGWQLDPEDRLYLE